MSALEKTSKITCLISTEKLNVIHDGNTTSFNTANGVYFRLDRNDNAWKLFIEEGKQVDRTNAPKGYTEINTLMTKSSIEFSDLDGPYDPDPILRFIGIEDIRDGITQPNWDYMLRKSYVSIKTIQGTNRLSIRKAHYTS